MKLRALAAAFVLSLSSAAAADLLGQADLDPRTWRSPSGAYEWTVDPTDRRGAGPARVWLACDGERVWSAQLPYTPIVADVDDAGHVAACGYLAGPAGDEAVEDAVVVAAFQPDGRRVLEARLPRTGAASCLGWTSPNASGVLLDRANERVLARILDSGRESWRTWSLASGRAGPDLEPPWSGAAASVWCADLRAVPATPLFLARWNWTGDTRFGSTLALLEPDGRVAWRLDWEGDQVPRPGSPRVLELAPARFALRHVARDEFVTFAVERTERGWRARELARGPFRAPEPAWARQEERLAAAPRLRPLGSIELSGDEEAPWTEDIAIGPADGIHLLHEGALVRVYSADGARLRSFAPPATELREHPRRPRLEPQADGGVHVLGVSARNGTALSFGPRGDFLGHAPGSPGVLRPPVWARVPASPAWKLHLDRVELLESDLRTRLLIERAEGGRWLQDLWAGAVAPDGALAAATIFNGRLRIWSPDGELRADVEPQVRTGLGVQLDFDGRHVAVGLGERGAALLDCSGAVVAACEPQGAGSWRPLFARRGRELWLFDGRRRIERYAVP